MNRLVLRFFTLSCVCAAFNFAGANVTTTIYGSWTTTDDGTPFADPIGTFTSPAEDYGTSTGFQWHPFGQGSFGAKTTGFLNLSAGFYAFGTDSDDGSSLTIDGTEVEDNGGPHGEEMVLSSPAFYSAGQHAFSTNFFEDFGGGSGVDLVFQTFDANGNPTSDVHVVPPSMLSTPSPAAALPFLAGLMTRRKRRK